MKSLAWHSDLHKRKPSGGKKIPYRGRRKFERGGPTIEVVERVRGGNVKVRLYSVDRAQVSDPKKGKTTLSKILKVIRNPANLDYNRRGIITKGALIQTELGVAKVTSKPSQNGVVNAVIQPKA